MGAFDIILEFVNEKLWLAAFILPLFLHTCPRKPHFPARLAVGAMGLVVLGLLPRLWEVFAPGAPLVSFWLTRELLVWPVLLGLYMGALFRTDWNMKLFAAITGLCTQELMFGLWAIISVAFPGLHTPVGELLICAVMGAGLTVGLHYFLAVKLTPRTLETLRRRSLIPLLALYVLAGLMLSYASYSVLSLVLFFDPIRAGLAAAGVPVDVARLRFAVVLTNVIGDAVLLFALRYMLRYSESDLERELLQQIREQDRKQYARFRSNVDYINTKCHDLKHYLALLQKNNTAGEEELRRVEESIAKLDAETHSGNETLDLILTDRRLLCASRGIDLVFQTDGTPLEQLDVIDTYTVFCNLLDNAIECVEGLPPEARRIRLGIRAVRRMVFIHQSNPLPGVLELEDGLPSSTKGDPTLHGFGLKSVRDTVKKRGGELLIRAQDGQFQLDICLPAGK